MAKQVTRDRKLTPEEAAKYRKIREEVELEKPEIIAKAQQARSEARRQQLVAIMQELKAAREARGLSRPTSMRERAWIVPRYSSWKT